MLTNIILHIGAPKCGSTAIQTFLATNKDILSANNFIVPDVSLELTGDVEGHQVWLFDRYRHSPETSSNLLLDKINAISEFCRNSEHPSTLIVSAENLCEIEHADIIFAPLRDQFPIHVIFYIRRQDDFLISAWKQWHYKIEPDFWAWVIANAPSYGNWKAQIENWENIVGRSNIDVRCYERSRLTDNDIVSDFIEAANLSHLRSKLIFPHVQKNKSLQDSLIRLLHSANLTPNAHDTIFEDELRALTQGQLDSTDASQLITYRQRTAILYIHQSGNSWIRQTYFPTSVDGLFTDISTQREKYELSPIRDPIQGQLDVIMIIIKSIIEKLDHIQSS